MPAYNYMNHVINLKWENHLQIGDIVALIHKNNWALKSLARLKAATWRPGQYPYLVGFIYRAPCCVNYHFNMIQTISIMSHHLGQPWTILIEDHKTEFISMTTFIYINLIKCMDLNCIFTACYSLWSEHFWLLSQDHWHMEILLHFRTNMHIIFGMSNLIQMNQVHQS